jgi:hypothetical protein
MPHTPFDRHRPAPPRLGARCGLTGRRAGSPRPRPTGSWTRRSTAARLQERAAWTRSRTAVAPRLRQVRGARPRFRPDINRAAASPTRRSWRRSSTTARSRRRRSATRAPGQTDASRPPCRRPTSSGGACGIPSTPGPRTRRARSSCATASACSGERSGGPCGWRRYVQLDEPWLATWSTHGSGPRRASTTSATRWTSARTS